MEMNAMSRDEKEKSRETTNLYSCKMDISLPRQAIPSTKKILGNVLRYLDPGWKFIRIREDKKSPLRGLTNLNNSSSDDNGSETHSTQSLSVILFLHEDRCGGSLLDSEKYGMDLMSSPPWKLHHNVELLNKIDSSVVASHNFYELSPIDGLPLWAVAPVHYGNEILRFNISAQNFEKMKDFYKTLLEKSCAVSRMGFCYFVVYTHPGLEVHLALKSQTFMRPRCNTRAALRLKFRKLDEIKRRLLSPPVLIHTRLWQTEDPDGNILLLDEISSEPSHWTHKRRSHSHLAKDDLVFV